jgi:hypothetical protein
MRSPFSEKRDFHLHPFRFARQLLTIAIVFSIMVVLTIAADIIFRSSHQDENARAWMQALTLSAPALWSAGTPMRHPETMHPGVALEFIPGMVSMP